MAGAEKSGHAVKLFCGRDADVVRALHDDVLHGTLVLAQGDRLRARKQWLRHAPSSGRLHVDAGAFAALHRQGASLLPGGVVSAEGEFRRGDVVEIGVEHEPAFARGLAQYGANEVRRIARRHSNEIEAILGFRYGESVVHRDDLVLIDATSHKETRP